MDTFVNPLELSKFRGLGFSKTLKYFIQRASISTEALAAKCGITPYLIRKVLAMEGDRTSNYISFTFPIVIGIGLELPPSGIHFLLRKAGYALSNPGEPYNNALADIIDLPYPKTVEECNSIMEKAGFERLTDFDILVPDELRKD